MPKRLHLLVVGILFFFLFVFFSFLVHKNLFTTFDFDATVRLQDNISRRLDNEFSLLSDVGKFEVMTIVLIVMVIFSKQFIAGIVAFSLYVGFHLIELFGKFFVDHPPPPQFMLRTEHLIDFPQFHVRSEFSYPSGHSGRAVFIATILVLLVWQSRRLSLPMKLGISMVVVVYVGAMLISRPYLGEHWSTDVIGGALLGGSFALISGSFLNKHKNKKGSNKTSENQES